MQLHRILVVLKACGATALALGALFWPGPWPAAADPGDTVADRVFGQTNFTSNICSLAAVSASTLCPPVATALDGAGNLYVADRDSNRVLQYNSPLTTDATADRVFGQPNFTSMLCNQGAASPSASSLCAPLGVALDGAGNLYVADNNNGRVLEYNSPLTTDAVADRVFGQGGSFTTGTCNLGGISASSLCGPVGGALDGAGNLYVADGNSRVLEFNSPLTTDAVADRVFGQGGSFTSGTCNLGGISANSLCFPQGLALDGTGNLYVAEGNNSRVLEYNSPLTTDAVADRVFGQGGSFTSNTCNLGGISASSLCVPYGVALDSGGNLYVGDTNNVRVLEYNNPLTTDVIADRVFGQAGSFTTAACNQLSASSLCQPRGVALDGAGNLYVADYANNRVLEYDSPLAPVGGLAGAPDVVAQSSWSSWPPALALAALAVVALTGVALAATRRRT